MGRPTTNSLRVEAGRQAVQASASSCQKDWQSCRCPSPRTRAPRRRSPRERAAEVMRSSGLSQRPAARPRCWDAPTPSASVRSAPAKVAVRKTPHHHHHAGLGGRASLTSGSPCCVAGGAATTPGSARPRPKRAGPDGRLEVGPYTPSDHCEREPVHAPPRTHTRAYVVDSRLASVDRPARHALWRSTSVTWGLGHLGTHTQRERSRSSNGWHRP